MMSSLPTPRIRAGSMLSVNMPKQIFKMFLLPGAGELAQLLSI